MKEAIKNFILSKANEIFKEKGFKDTTIEEIAKASKISIPTIYNYFSGKDEILFNIVISFYEEIDKKLEPILYNKKSFSKKLEELIDTIFHFGLENKEIMRISFFEARIFFESIDSKEKDRFKMLLEMRDKKMKFFDNLFLKGQEENYVRIDFNTHLLSLFLTSILRECFLEILIRGASFEGESKKMKKEILKLLKNGIFESEDK